jgi:NAD(P)H-dependent FMN reductase
MAALFSRSPQKPLNVVVMLGTIRQGRMSEVAADFISKKLASRPLVSVSRIDVRQFNFDFGSVDYGTAVKERFPFYRDAIVKADALVIVTPEYNHGYPGSLKMVLDILYPEYKHKAAALIGVSSGPWGGVRAVENLTPVLKELGLVVSQLALNIERVDDAFTTDGVPANPVLAARADKFVSELLWLAESLRWGRQNLT